MKTIQKLKLILGTFATLAVIYVVLIQVQQSPINLSNVDFWRRSQDEKLFIVKNNVTIPDVFARDNLWRPRFPNNSIDRWMFQRQWAINVSRSNYMKSVTKKKRILVIGAFNLDDVERTLPCDEDGVNMSQFCELVEDLPLLPYVNYDEFDAVLSRRDWNLQFYEPQVPPRLLSFFHIEESPYTLHQGDFRPNNPILASYWRGSDIEAPYYKWIPFNNSTTSKGPSKNYAQNKYKLAAIVVSHCPTYNDRLRYVTKLQEFIPVDIYGGCGPLLACGEDCFRRITADYKFYLAFENANCRDYITEKFFRNALGNDIVPVVLGAHRYDYMAAAPPLSYIHVEDFESHKELANYLTLLDQNDTLYNEYFEWKGSGEIVNGHHDLFCRVCAFLYYAEFYPPPKWPEDSFRWLEVNPCLKPGEHFWESTTSPS